MKYIFCMQISMEIDSMILTGIVKHSERSQNGKFVMSLQYLKKEGRDGFVRKIKYS